MFKAATIAWLNGHEFGNDENEKLSTGLPSSSLGVMWESSLLPSRPVESKSLCCTQAESKDDTITSHKDTSCNELSVFGPFSGQDRPQLSHAGLTQIE